MYQRKKRTDQSVTDGAVTDQTNAHQIKEKNNSIQTKNLKRNIKKHLTENIREQLHNPEKIRYSLRYKNTYHPRKYW